MIRRALCHVTKLSCMMGCRCVKRDIRLDPPLIHRLKILIDKLLGQRVGLGAVTDAHAGTDSPRDGRLKSGLDQFGPTPEPPRPHPPDHHPEEHWKAHHLRLLDTAAQSGCTLDARLATLFEVEAGLDRLFSEHLGEVKRQLALGVGRTLLDQRSPGAQLAAALEAARVIDRAKHDLYTQLLGDLERHGIRISASQQLDSDQRLALREQLQADILPILTPMAIDRAAPFPFLTAGPLHLLAALQYPGEKDSHLAYLRLPTPSPYAARLIAADEATRAGRAGRYVTLEDLVAENLDLLFPDMIVLTRASFRVTRARVSTAPADPASEGEVGSLREGHPASLDEAGPIHDGLTPAVRLEVDARMQPSHRGMLAAELDLDGALEVFDVPGMIDLRGLADLRFHLRGVTRT